MNELGIGINNKKKLSMKETGCKPSTNDIPYISEFRKKTYHLSVLVTLSLAIENLHIALIY